MYYNFSPSEQKKMLQNHILGIESNSNLDLKVKSKLLKPHWIISNYKKGKKFKKPDVYHYDKYFDDGNMTLNVYENNKKRILLIMDCLLKNLEKLGYNFKFQRPGLFLEKDGILVGIQILEKHKRIKDNSEQYSISELMPTGFLKLQLYRSLHKKEYAERKTFSFQENISKLLGYIETFRDLEEDYQRELEKGWEEQRKRRDKEDEIKKRIDFELEVFNHFVSLENRISRLDKLRKIRESLEIQLNDNFAYKGLPKQEYFKKIDNRLEWLHPFSEINDDLLTENHKTKFLELL